MSFDLRCDKGSFSIATGTWSRFINEWVLLPLGVGPTDQDRIFFDEDHGLRYDANDGAFVTAEQAAAIALNAEGLALKYDVPRFKDDAFRDMLIHLADFCKTTGKEGFLVD